MWADTDARLMRIIEATGSTWHCSGSNSPIASRERPSSRTRPGDDRRTRPPSPALCSTNGGANVTGTRHQHGRGSARHGTLQSCTRPVAVARGLGRALVELTRDRLHAATTTYPPRSSTRSTVPMHRMSTPSCDTAPTARRPGPGSKWGTTTLTAAPTAEGAVRRDPSGDQQGLVLVGPTKRSTLLVGHPAWPRVAAVARLFAHTLLPLGSVVGA